MKTTIFLAAALSSVAFVAAPALAQTADTAARPITGYGSLGYSRFDDATKQDSVTGRLGLRYGRFVGAEAEGSFGVGDKTRTIGGVPYKSELDRSIAAYAVGYVPLTSRLDLFGRVGLGNNKYTTTVGGVTDKDQRDTINYGGGAQYFFTGADGIRADFTRESYRGGPGHANVWGASYVRKF